MKDEIWEEHPKLPGCFILTRNSMSYRVSDKGWCVLRLPDLKILGYGATESLEQACQRIRRFVP